MNKKKKLKLELLWIMLSAFAGSLGGALFAVLIMMIGEILCLGVC